MGPSSSTFGGDAGMNDFAGPILRFAGALRRAWRRSKDFRVLVYLVVLLLLSGTVFYSIVEGWSPLDAFYFSATTLTTVGFGDLAPQTALGKLGTVLYLFVGLGIIGGFINTVAKESWSTGDMRQSGRESQEDAPGS
jgi:voltage-gated potassium channel